MSDKSYVVRDGKVFLKGSEGYWSFYDMGTELEKRFPGQDASDFTGAIGNGAGVGPLKDPSLGIEKLTCEQAGENDGESWIWTVALSDGSLWRLEASCDYTGWGCQDGGEWDQLVQGQADKRGPVPGFNTPDSVVEELRDSNAEVREQYRKLEKSYQELSKQADHMMVELLRLRADAIERELSGEGGTVVIPVFSTRDRNVGK